MHNQEQGSFFELLKDRPLIFTFAWVFCLSNWKSIWWFLTEPLKFSIKLDTYEQLGFDFCLWVPVLWTVFATIFYPLAVHIPDFFRGVWQNEYDTFKANREPTKFIEKKEYEKLAKKLENESKSATDAINQARHVTDELTQKQDRIESLKLEENELNDQLRKLRIQDKNTKENLLQSNEQFEGMSNKFNHLSQAHLELSNTLEKYKDQKIDIEKKYNQLLSKNKTLEKKYSEQIHKFYISSHQKNPNLKLAPNKKAEIVSKLDKTSSTPTYFIENYSQIMNTPFIGIVINDCLYQAGKLIYIPDSYKSKNVFIKIISSCEDTDLLYGFRFPDSNIIHPIPDEGTLVPYTTEEADLNSNKFIELVTTWRGSPDLATDVYEVEFSDEIEKYKIEF
ncbi:hypothetical protein J8L73_02330 [Pseudoalteromonas sp. MMG006]|uniref:hypothetical protein n=1 Tax=Pseudoalteromonas sp. MMG006 TaxID=2822683 RepID=UPI001B38E1A5|nr:hypothetical protein [Pseudoalteromonas sp. MMG006]MBQ4797985.1 hypothetical protein [Pseudoalteromonas sp. MMG006]